MRKIIITGLLGVAGLSVAACGSSTQTTRVAAAASSVAKVKAAPATPDPAPAPEAAPTRKTDLARCNKLRTDLYAWADNANKAFASSVSDREVASTLSRGFEHVDGEFEPLLAEATGSDKRQLGRAADGVNQIYAGVELMGEGNDAAGGPAIKQGFGQLLAGLKGAEICGGLF